MFENRYRDLEVLIQNGVGDSVVTPLAGRIMARNINSTLLEVGQYFIFSFVYASYHL